MEYNKIYYLFLTEETKRKIILVIYQNVLPKQIYETGKKITEKQKQKRKLKPKLFFYPCFGQVDAFGISKTRNKLTQIPPIQTTKYYPLYSLPPFPLY